VMLDLTCKRRGNDGLAAPQKHSQSHQTRPVLCSGHKLGHQTPKHNIYTEVPCRGQSLHEAACWKLEHKIGHVPDKRELGEMVSVGSSVSHEAHVHGIQSQLSKKQRSSLSQYVEE
jgi:hypothetical protein